MRSQSFFIKEQFEMIREKGKPCVLTQAIKKQWAIAATSESLGQHNDAYTAAYKARRLEGQEEMRQWAEGGVK